MGPLIETIMKNKITPSQANVLAAMRMGYILRFVAGHKSYCWLDTPIPQNVTLSAYALERSGHIERYEIRAGGCKFRLKE